MTLNGTLRLTGPALLLGLAVTMAGCGDAPTQPRPVSATLTPTRPQATATPTPHDLTPTPTPRDPAPTRTPLIPTPTPAPPVPTPAFNLTGTWQGTIVTSAYCYPRKYGRTCPGSEGVRVTLSQSGTLLTGSLTTSCEGPLELQGSLNGMALSLLFVRKDGTPIGPMQGSAWSSTALNAYSVDQCDPWGYDSTIGIALSR